MKLAEDDEVSVEVAALPVRFHPSPAVKEGAPGASGVGGNGFKCALIFGDIWCFQRFHNVLE